MNIEIVNIGAGPDDGTGDTLREGGRKINANFATLAGAIGSTAVGIPVVDTVAALPNAADNASPALVFVQRNNNDPADPANGVYQKNAGKTAYEKATWYFRVSADQVLFGNKTVAQRLAELDQEQDAIAAALQARISASGEALGVATMVGGDPNNLVVRLVNAAGVDPNTLVAGAAAEGFVIRFDVPASTTAGQPTIALQSTDGSVTTGAFVIFNMGGNGGALEGGDTVKLRWSAPGSVWYPSGRTQDSARAITNWAGIVPCNAANDGGNVNRIVLTPKPQIAKAAAFYEGIYVTFVVPATTTSEAVDGVHVIYAGADFPLYPFVYGGPFQGGETVCLRHPGNGSDIWTPVWRSSTIGAAQDKGTVYAGVSAVTGDRNAITLAYPAGSVIREGTAVHFDAGFYGSNSGPVTINGLQVVKATNSPLTGGEIGEYTPTIVRFNAAGNSWKLYLGLPNVPGSAKTADKLDANIVAIRTTLRAVPNGTQTFARGVKALVKNLFVTVGTGSSVGNGAGSFPIDGSGGNDLTNAPSTIIGNYVMGLLGAGNFDRGGGNYSVGGSFDSEFPGQLANYPGGVIHLSTATAGMNAASRFGQHAAATRPGQLAGVEAWGDAIVAKGGIPVVIDTPEPEPINFVAAGGAGGLQTWNWTDPTYNVTGPSVVNAAAKTMTVFFRDYDPFGGTKLKVGSLLRRTSGPNAGDHIITAFLDDGGTVVIGGGTLSQDENSTVQMLHIVSDAEADNLLEIRPNETFINDVVRYPGGPPMILNRLWESYNQGLAELCARKRWPLVRWSIAAQRWIAEHGVPTLQWNKNTKTVTGDRGGYLPAFSTVDAQGNRTIQYNHPADAMRSGALHPLLFQVAYDIVHGADLRGKVYGG